MKLKRILTTALVTMALGMLAACGSSHKSSQGQVVKGPVNGATVTFDGDATKTSTTNENGYYKILQKGVEVTSTGGKYIDIATGTIANAPDMKAEAGATVITPITTVMADMTDAEKADFKQALKELGINNPLTFSPAKVTAATKEATELNEILGFALVNTTPAKAKELANALAAAVLIEDEADSEAAISTAIKTFETDNSVTIPNYDAILDGIIEDGGKMPIVKDKDETGATGGTDGGTTED